MAVSINRIIGPSSAMFWVLEWGSQSAANTQIRTNRHGTKRLMASKWSKKNVVLWHLCKDIGRVLLSNLCSATEVLEFVLWLVAYPSVVWEEETYWKDSWKHLGWETQSLSRWRQQRMKSILVNRCGAKRGDKDLLGGLSVGFSSCLIINTDKSLIGGKARGHA